MLCYRIYNFCELATTKLNFQMQYANENFNKTCLIVIFFVYIFFYKSLIFLKQNYIIIKLTEIFYEEINSYVKAIKTIFIVKNSFIDFLNSF